MPREWPTPKEHEMLLRLNPVVHAKTGSTYAEMVHLDGKERLFGGPGYQHLQRQLLVVREVIAERERLRNAAREVANSLAAHPRGSKPAAATVTEWVRRLRESLEGEP